jgi:hypothetical protein
MVGVGTPNNFEGRYCHGDGYPTGVGKSLWDNWHITFNGNLQKLADFVLKTDYGWSMLAGTDFSLEPRWYEYDQWEQYNKHPRWYDTRNPEFRGDKWAITERDMLIDSWMEWAYLINIETNSIDIYKLSQVDMIFVGTMAADVEPDYETFEK